MLSRIILLFMVLLAYQSTLYADNIINPLAYATTPDDYTPICPSGSTCSRAILINGVKRTFTVYIPSGYAPNQRYFNLLIALHDTHQTGVYFANQVLNYQLNKIKHTIIVYPDAAVEGWNDAPSRITKADDVAFISKLIHFFDENYHVNPFRVYVVGMGTGGSMAFRLACERADMISAIATVAAAMPTALLPVCKPSRPISVLMVNGRKDPILPWDSQTLFNLATLQPLDTRLTVPATYRAWLTIDTIRGMTQQGPVPPETANNTWAWTMSTRGDNGAEVVLYTLYQAGHTWPGGLQYLPVATIGNPSALDISEPMWQFLLGNRLQPLIVPPIPPVDKSVINGFNNFTN